MHALLAFLLFAAPFWEAKPPADWTVEELRQLLTDSPWAQPAEPSRPSPGTPLVPVYFATAKPMRLAEEEARRRFRKKGTEEGISEIEYREFLEQDGGKSIVIAIRMRDELALADATESDHMEQESMLRIGHRKYKVKMQFPPGANDPFVRLVFPRDIRTDDRRIDLELYIPGTGAPYREASFNLKEMMFEGKLEL